MERAIAKVSKIFDIRHYQIVHEQMIVMDRMFINLKDITLQSYRDLYHKSDLHKEPQYPRDLRAFEKVFDFVAGHGKDSLRNWVRNNHLTEKTETEFLSYVKDTTHTLMVDLSASFDTEYWSGDFLVSREDIKKWNYDNHTGEVETLMEGCLYVIRDIARTKEAEIQAIENENVFV